MATIKRGISRKTDLSGNAEIMLRLSVSRKTTIRLKSGIYVDAKRFKGDRFVYPRAMSDETIALRTIENRLYQMEQMIVEACNTMEESKLTKEFFEEAIDRFNHPEKYVKIEEKVKEMSFFDLFDMFIGIQKTDWPTKHCIVLKHTLQRYELYRKQEKIRPYKLNVHTFDLNTLKDFEWFIRHEFEVYKKYPKIYDIKFVGKFGERQTPRPVSKGSNTVVGLFKRLRSFFNWMNEKGYSNSKPFAEYNGVRTEVYGTPYYLTIEERDRIADFDLSEHPQLEIQRDIFIFQCLIGCRVSDLLDMTPISIVNDAVEYVPQKTKGKRPLVVRVPLNSRARALVEKYKGKDPQGRLFPFITSQKYNDALKKIFTLCGINRIVLILNSATGEEEPHPLNEVASSHIARRTFVGNLYKKVKDPNLVGALSGHKDGSKAFARYRDIDEDIKRELVSLLD